MWWIVFTAVDLYTGLVVLKLMAPSVPPPKRQRMIAAERIVIAGLAFCAVAFLVKLWR
jgi:hypothetical protein